MDFFLGVQLHFTIDQNIDLYSIHSLPIRDIFCGIFRWKSPGKEWNGERSFMAQHAILRFEKHKGNPARPLEAHHERQKEQYASNPDIDTSRSKYNFYIVKPEGRCYHFIQSRIEQAGDVYKRQVRLSVFVRITLF